MDKSIFNPNVELHKLEEDGRKRVFRACISCRKSRRKCNGETPCNMCSHRNEVCEYDAPKKRGPPPKAKGDGSGHTGQDDEHGMERNIAAGTTDSAKVTAQPQQTKKRSREQGSAGGRAGGKGAKGMGAGSMVSEQGSGMFISGMLLPSSTAGSLFHPSSASMVLQGLGRPGGSTHGGGTEGMQGAASVALGLPQGSQSVMQQAAWLGFGGGSIVPPSTVRGQSLPPGMTRQGSELSTLTGLLGQAQTHTGAMKGQPGLTSQPSYPLPYGSHLGVAQGGSVGAVGSRGMHTGPAMPMPMPAMHRGNGTVFEGSASVAMMGPQPTQAQHGGEAMGRGPTSLARAGGAPIPRLGQQGMSTQHMHSEPPPPHLLPPEGPQEPAPVGASLHASIYEVEHALIVPTVEERMYCKQYLLYQQRAFLPLVDETAFLGDLALVLQCAASAREAEKSAAVRAGRQPDWSAAHGQAAQAATAVLGVDRLLALRALFHAVVAFGAAVVGRKGRAVEYFRAARVYALPCTRKPNVHTVSLLYILAFLMKGWEGHSDAGLGTSPGLGFSAAMMSLSEDAVYRVLGGYLALSGAVPDLPHNLRLTALLMEYARMHKEAVMKMMHETCPLPGAAASAQASTPGLPFMSLPNPVQTLLPYPAREPGPAKEGEDPVIRLAKIYTYLLAQMRDDFSAARDAAGAKVIDSLHQEASQLSSRLKAWAPSPLPFLRLMVKVYLHTRAALPSLMDVDLTALCYGYKYAANCDTSKSNFGVFVLTAKLVNLLLERADKREGQGGTSSPPPWSPVGYTRLSPEDPLRVLPYAAHFLYEAQHSGLCPTQACGEPGAAPPNLLATAGVEGVVDRDGAGRTGAVQPHPPSEATDEHVTALCMLSSDPEACVSNVKSAMASHPLPAPPARGSGPGPGGLGAFTAKPAIHAASSARALMPGSGAACPGHTKAMDAINKAVQGIQAYGLATVVRDLPSLPAHPPQAVAAAMGLSQCPKSAGMRMAEMDEGDRESVAVGGGEEEEGVAARAHPASSGLLTSPPAALPRGSPSLISGVDVQMGQAEGGGKASKAGRGRGGGMDGQAGGGATRSNSRSTAQGTGGAIGEGSSSSAGATPSVTGPTGTGVDSDRPLAFPGFTRQMSMDGGAVVANSVLDYQFGSPSLSGGEGLPPAAPLALSFQDVNGFIELPMPY